MPTRMKRIGTKSMMTMNLLTYISPETSLCRLWEENNFLASGPQAGGEDMTTGDEEDW